MRPAAKRLIWVPAATGAVAALSAGIACWATHTPLGLAACALICARVLASLIFRLDRLRWQRMTFRDAVTAALACAGGSAIAAALSATVPGPWPARMLAVDAALYPCLLLGLAAAPLLRELRAKPSGPHRVRTLIWGAGAEGRALLERLRRTDPAVEVFGWLDDDPVLAELDCDGLPVLGPVESLPLLVELHGVQAVLVAIPSLPADRRAVAEDLARWSGAKLISTPSLPSSLEALADAVSAPAALPQATR